jgi:ABC-type nitrate/sulfonate/bicarbonate transport system substrate-binding protein
MQRAFSILLAGYALAIAGLAPSGAWALDKILLGGAKFTTYAGQQKGFYAAAGLEVEVPTFPNSDALRNALAQGKIHMASFGVDNALAMVETMDVVIIMAGESSPIQMMGQKGMASTEQLRGKTILVDAPNTQNAVIMKRILSKQGLEPGRDYQMKEAGGQPLRLVELRKDPNAAGTMVSWPVYFQMKSEGYPTFGSSLDVVGPMMFQSTFLMRDFAKKNRELVVRHLAAEVKTIRWLMAPENRAEVIGMLGVYLKASPEVAALAYDGFTGPYGWAKDGEIDLERLSTVMKLRAEVEGSWGGKAPPPQTYIDTTYLAEAVKTIGR